MCQGRVRPMYVGFSFALCSLHHILYHFLVQVVACVFFVLCYLQLFPLHEDTFLKYWVRPIKVRPIHKQAWSLF